MIFYDNLGILRDAIGGYLYWKPKEPLLVYDYSPEPIPEGLRPVELLDAIIKSGNDTPDAYEVVAEAVMKIVQEHLGYLGDILVGLHVGDYNTVERGQLNLSDKGEPYYYVAEKDWWEGEGKIWINYIVLEDYTEVLMEGVEPNA